METQHEVEAKSGKRETSTARTMQLEGAAPVDAAPKKRSPLVFVALAALVTLVGIGLYLIVTGGQEDTDDAQVASDMVPVGTRVAGQIVHVDVAENSLVKKGQAIAEIDDADFVARVNQAEAELQSAEAQAQAADAQVSVVEASSRGGLASARAAFSGSSMNVGGAAAQVAAARAGLVRAQTELKRTEIDLARDKELKAANAIPQEKLDNAQLAHDSAQAALAQAQAAVSVAEEARRAAESHVEEAKGLVNQSSPAEARIATARAQAALAHAHVKSAQATLELAKLQLSYTKIIAPADGIASKLSVHDGQTVQMGQPVIELVPNATYVIANFKETQIGKMKAGQRAVIRIDAFPGKKLIGKVESLSGATGASFSLMPADNATGNFVKVVQRVPVRIAWESPPELPLRAGLSADVTVEVGH